MRDSMHILDQLQRRGYEPQGKGCFDRRYHSATVRVLLTGRGGLRLAAFDAHKALEWGAQFDAEAPVSVIFAALNAAEKHAARAPYTA